MRPQMTEISIIDVIKVVSVQTAALSIALSDVKEILGIISLCIAISYGLWKWRQDVKVKKNNKNT